MALQNTYLADQAWGMRTNVDEILSRFGTKSTGNQPQRCRIPELGLLSRTVVQSPTVRWVIPARIRNRDMNDVIFIGENSVQIKELTSNGDLRYFLEVATKSDFDVPIIGAKAISAHTERSLEDLMRLNARHDDGDVEMTDGLDEKAVPPQVLVLVLASREIIFMFAVETVDGELEFVHDRKPLPAEPGVVQQHGRHICVDPKSRAIAISSGPRSFTFIALETPEDLQFKMKRGHLKPVAEERFFRAGGEILNMEFLYPSAQESDHVLLLLLIAQEGETRIVLYDWICTESVRLIAIKSAGRKLPKDYSFPSLVIPLKHPASFLAVCPSGMLVFKNISSPEGNRKPTTHGFPHIDEGSAEAPWSFWARPMRNPNRQAFDDIFLCRRDGKCLYLEIGANGQIHRQSQPGRLGCSIDTAFTIIDGGFEAGDLLLAFGSLGGGLFIADAREQLKCVQRFTNWAPVVDSIIVRATAPQETYRTGCDCGTGAIYDRIFTCSGTGMGAVTELRHGVEARIGLLIDQGDSSGVTDLWAIPVSKSGAILLLFSDPLSSSLLEIPADAEDISEVSGEAAGIETGAPTLAVTTTPDGVVIQVTPVSVNLSFLGNQPLRNSSRFDDLDERIIAAAASSKASMFAIAIRKAADVRVEVYRVSIGENGIEQHLVGEPLSLTQEQEPACLALARIGEENALFIGSVTGKVLVDIVGSKHAGCLYQKEIELPGASQDSTICENMAVVTAAGEGGMKYTLLCGLRSGNLVHFALTRSEGALCLESGQNAIRKLGDTSVRIRAYENDTSFAVITCNAVLWKVSLAGGGGGQRLIVDNIWFTDRNDPSRSQSAVDVFACVELQPHEYPGPFGGSLICISQDQIMACTLEGTPRTVPRHMALPGSPKRLIYSNFLKRLVVGYYTTDLETDIQHLERANRFRLAFVDPDGDTATSAAVEIPDGLDNSNKSSQLSQNSIGLPDEEVTSLLDWQYSSGDRMYHMIVIGTARLGENPSGRLIYVVTRPSKKSLGHIDTTVKYVYTYDFPVRAISTYKPASLVVAVQDQVILQCLNVTTKRWRKLPPFRVESPVVSFTVKEPYIYALTEKHSLVILKVSEDRLSLYGHDGSDRMALSHVNLFDDSQITMVSSIGGCITGLTDSGLTREGKLLRSLFTAHLPLTVNRLCRSFAPTAQGVPPIVYGTTLDGAVYRFRVLKEIELRLLGFIQKLCLMDPDITPFIRRHRNAIPGTNLDSLNKPESRHIKGDVLSRLVDRGASYLEKLVRMTGGNEPVPRPSADNSVAPSDAPEQIFRDYSRPIIGEVSNPYVAVTQWIKDLIRPG